MLNCMDMQCASSHVTQHVNNELPAIFYERESGAASQPVPAGYRRHEPEKTVFYSVVSEHLETLLYDARQQDESGTGYPRFVEHEFRRYLDCGLLSRGFARLRCPSILSEVPVRGTSSQNPLPLVADFGGDTLMRI